ncbi:MAG: putative multidrug export ATP-binding/permease protein [bacterium]|nr:putative multidrug export ATP-binding/permease protein [bacterium]
MGILKFCLPLIFPLALKFITDDILVSQSTANAMASTREATSRIFGWWTTKVAALLPILGNGKIGLLNALALTMLVIYIMLAIATFYRSDLAGRAGHRLVFDLRFDFYLHIQRMSHHFFSTQRSGSIVSRFMSDVALAQNFVGSALTNVWMDSASLIFIIYILFYLEARLAWVALAVMPCYVVLIRYMSPRIKKASRASQEKLEEISGDLQEKIGGISVVKAFNQERREARQFFHANHELSDMFIYNVHLSSWNQAISGFLTTVAPLVVVWIAALFVLRAEMTVGTMIAFYSFLGSLYFPLQRFSELGLIVSNSLAAIERIFEYFDIAPQITEKPNALTLSRLRGHVCFEQVNFAYEQQMPTLLGIDFDIKPGEMVALVGASGSGKSTLVSLIPRFYDVTAGRVLLDSTDVREVTFKSLRRQIGLVLQDSILFSTTLRENLLYGRPQATETELHTAAEAANATEFIKTLPGGFDTVIGERGIKLSGGQRQRIAIARAFLKDPRILILDEATSSLDSESEHLIQEALARLMRGRTTIIIAHRLSTVVEADKIVVLQNGRVVEIGRHDELLRRGGHYAFLARRQFRDTLPLVQAAA